MPIDAGLFIPTRSFVDTQVPTLTNNYYTVPNTMAFSVRLIQIPQSGVVTPPSATDPIVVQRVDPVTDAVLQTYTPISSGTPTGSQVLIDADTFATGTLSFGSQSAGIRLKFIYQGVGSTLFAADLNDITSGNLLKDGSIKSRHLSISSLVLTGNLTVGGSTTLSGSLSISALTVSGLSYLGKLANDPAPSVANEGCLYYNTVDHQYKGVAATGTGTYETVILG